MEKTPDIRPQGADNFLKWRRSIDEHLELRRQTWNEYAMFNWLCTKASAHTGTLRTSWPTLAEQTGLTRKHVEKLCRGLKQKRYIWYLSHPGVRGRLVEVSIHKFPLADKTYTDLSRHFEPVPVPVLVPVPLPVLAEVGEKTPRNSARSEALKTEKEKEKHSLRVRSADPTHQDKFLNEDPERLLSKAEALTQAPPALRETLELFCFKTGCDAIDPADMEWLDRLDAAHTPAVIQKAITTAVERFERRGDDPAALTLQYIWESLRHYTTRKPPEARHHEVKPKYPLGLTRLW